MLKRSSWQSWHMMWVTWPFVAGLLFCWVQSRNDATTAHRQRTAPALITAHEPYNHNQYRYTFEIADKRYSGLGNAQNDSAFIGENTTVYYDPQNPSVNSLVSFGDRSIQDASIIPFLAFGIAGIAACIVIAKANATSRSTVGGLHSK